MAFVAEKTFEHVGESKGMENHDHDIVQDLSKRLDAMWRYDQYIANAEGHPHLQECWRDFKNQEMQNIQRLKDLIREEIQRQCF